MSKLLSISLFAILLSATSYAKENCDTKTHFTGPAAEELYSSLNIPEVPVPDKHNRSVYAYAKYGKLIGCEKTLNDNKIECWVIEPYFGNCD